MGGKLVGQSDQVTEQALQVISHKLRKFPKSEWFDNGGGVVIMCAYTVARCVN